MIRFVTKRTFLFIVALMPLGVACTALDGSTAADMLDGGPDAADGADESPPGDGDGDGDGHAPGDGDGDGDGDGPCEPAVFDEHSYDQACFQ
jgi:hypothetical protein